MVFVKQCLLVARESQGFFLILIFSPVTIYLIVKQIQPAKIVLTSTEC